DGSGQPSVRATQEFLLTFRRRNATLQIRMEHGTDETSDGRVKAVFMKQYQGDGHQLRLTGSVENGKLHYLVDLGRVERRIWWSERVLGLRGQQQLFRNRKFRLGDEVSFLAFEPTFATVVTRRARAISMEEVTTAAGRQKLLRVEQSTDR